MESAHERYLFTSCDASKTHFFCVFLDASFLDAFKHFPWYDVFISYISRFFHDRHISKSNMFYFVICLHTN